MTLWKIVPVLLDNLSVIEQLADEIYKGMYKTACLFYEFHAFQQH